MTSHIGLLVSFSLGAYLDWRRLAMVATAAPIALLIAALYIPETPSCLSLRGRDDQVPVLIADFYSTFQNVPKSFIFFTWFGLRFQAFPVERSTIWEPSLRNGSENWFIWTWCIFLNWIKWNRLSLVSKWQFFGCMWAHFLWNRSNWSKKKFIFNSSYFFELKKIKSIEPIVKIRNFWNIFGHFYKTWGRQTRTQAADRKQLHSDWIDFNSDWWKRLMRRCNGCEATTRMFVRNGMSYRATCTGSRNRGNHPYRGVCSCWIPPARPRRRPGVRSVYCARCWLRAD